MTCSEAVDGHMAGSILFESTVPVTKIEEIADSLKALHNSISWVDFHIRQNGASGWHIMAFHVIMPDSSDKAQRVFIYSFLQKLRDYLGTVMVDNKEHPKGVRQWTITPVCILV